MQIIPAPIPMNDKDRYKGEYELISNGLVFQTKKIDEISRMIAQDYKDLTGEELGEKKIYMMKEGFIVGGVEIRIKEPICTVDVIQKVIHDEIVEEDKINAEVSEPTSE